MTEAKKVIAGLERCLKHTCPHVGSKEYEECEYTVGIYCGHDRLLQDAIDLINQQEQDIVSLKKTCNDMFRSSQPVVLCNDCKYFDNNKFSGGGYCIQNEIYTTQTWFCADGERSQ